MRRSNTVAAQARRRRILAASDICHICGDPGADAVDHVIPLAAGGTDTADNMKPAHHNVEPKCNRIKGAKVVPPIIRRSGALTQPDYRPT